MLCSIIHVTFGRPSFSNNCDLFTMNCLICLCNAVGTVNCGESNPPALCSKCIQKLSNNGDPIVCPVCRCAISHCGGIKLASTHPTSSPPFSQEEKMAIACARMQYVEQMQTPIKVRHTRKF